MPVAPAVDLEATHVPGPPLLEDGPWVEPPRWLVADALVAGIAERGGMADEADAAVWAGLPAGEDLVRVLSGVDAAACSPRVQLAVARGWERVSWWAQVAATRAAGEFARSVAEGSLASAEDRCAAGDDAGLEASLVLGCSAGTAGDRAWQGMEYSGRMREVGDAVAAGWVSPWVGRDLVHRCLLLDDEKTAAFLALVMPVLVGRARASGVPLGWRAAMRAVRRALIRVDAWAARARRRDAQARSPFLSCTPGEDGMAWLSGYLPAPDAMAIVEGCDAIARARGATPRGSDGTMPLGAAGCRWVPLGRERWRTRSPPSPSMSSTAGPRP